MNTEQATGNFEQLKGKLKQTWAKMTDNDVMLYNGKRDEFFGKLKEHYGIAREDAEKKIHSLESAGNSDHATKIA